MDVIHSDVLARLVGDCGHDRISLFMPTHSSTGDNRVRFDGLLRRTQRVLVEAGMSADRTNAVLEGARELFEDVCLWERPRDGLALFTGPREAHCFWVPLSVPELVTVGDRFTITPLLPMTVPNGNFSILALSRDDIRLFEGNHHRLDSVVLEESPLALLRTMPRPQRAAVGTFRARYAGRSGKNGWDHDGDGDLRGSKDLIVEHFRRVDSALADVLRDRQSPLILAGADYVQELYRKVNTHPGLLASGIAGGCRDMSHALMHRRACEIATAARRDDETEELEYYRALRGAGYTLIDPGEVYAAAEQGRVATLFVSTRAARWEDSVRNAGPVLLENPPSAVEYPSLAAAATLRHGGSLRVLPAPHMPDETSVAAILRY